MRSNYEKILNEETSASRSLRKQLRQVSLAAEDSIWELQESNAELKMKLEAANKRLEEVNVFLDSDKGGLLLNMEEELAASRLRIAELEAEKENKGCENNKENITLSRGNMNTNGSNSSNNNGGKGKEKTASSSYGFISMLSY